MQRVDQSRVGKDIFDLLCTVGNSFLLGDKRADDAPKTKFAAQALRFLKETT
jgi:hypothetical protein